MASCRPYSGRGEISGSDATGGGRIGLRCARSASSRGTSAQGGSWGSGKAF